MTEPLSFPTLLHALQHWARETPDTVYLTQPEASGTVTDTSWKDAADQVNRVATHLRSLGLPAGSSIALLGRNSAHWILADLAIALAGHVSVPLYPALNADTAAFILEHSDARLLVIGKMDGIADGWNHIKQGIPHSLPVLTMPLAPEDDDVLSPTTRRITRWAEIVANTEPATDLALPEPKALATILYTSGSTGRPKGVMHSHEVIARGSHALRELLGTGPEDRLISYLPLAHVAERLAVGAVSIYSGCHVYFSVGLETFAQDLQRARPTVFFSVPRLWTKFYLSVLQKLPPAMAALIPSDAPQAAAVRAAVLTQLGLNETRVAMTGSAPLPQPIIDWYRALGLELLELYGMSENLAYSHAARRGQAKQGYVGHAMPGVEAKLSDVGELLVKSPCQMLGYYKDAEKTAAETTADGFFKTGDRGEFDDEGRVRITGRVKELFKTSKGKYVAPAPIENKLGSDSMVESACVTGSGQPQPFALLLLSPEARQQQLQNPAALEAPLAALLERVNAELEGHEQLDYLVVVRDAWTTENNTLTPTLKIKRDVIESRYGSRAEEWIALRRSVIWE